MALYANLNRSRICTYCLRLSFPNGGILRKFTSSNEKDISLDPDAVDNFTSQLVQRKTEKWETQKATLKKLMNDKAPSRTKVYPCGTNIEYLHISKINELLQNAIEIEDTNSVLDLSRQCLKFNKCPSLSILIHVLSICAVSGDKDMVVELTQLCEQQRPELLEDNSHFQHYLAEAIWVKGNITKSLKIFEQVYEENAYLRRRIRLMLKHLILHSITNRSEAALINIIEFSENLAHKYKDYFPLACIWQACFLSEWFSDQCIALQLLEKSDNFCKIITNRIAYVVNISLRNRNIDIVYRLLEVLLKHKLKAQYTGVLWALFDYQIRQGDLQRCLEIVQWSLKHDVVMPSIHQEKFLEVLVKNKVPMPEKKTDKPICLPTSFKF